MKFVVGLDMEVNDDTLTIDEAKTAVLGRFIGSGIKITNIRVLEDDR